MTFFDISARLRAALVDTGPFTLESLSKFFGTWSGHFHQAAPGDPILFHPGDALDTQSLLLRGAIFWDNPGGKQIIRGHPRIFPTSDHCAVRHQVLLEPIMAAAAHDAGMIAEPKLYGETIRVYSRNTDLYCATDVSHDGGNPMVGAGMVTKAAHRADYGSEAARILSARYPRIERLAKLGYVAVFVMQLPEMAPDHSLDRSDMVLVDVIDPDFVFVDRLEKERIAEDFALNVGAPASELMLTSSDPSALMRRLRALEHQPGPAGSAGFIVKTRVDDASDQHFCKIEPSSERDRDRGITYDDLGAVTEEITGQFGEGVWENETFAEDLMLEYLSTHHRSARWKVAQYLEDWRSARRAAGLA